jgi:hypothetical protein
LIFKKTLSRNRDTDATIEHGNVASAMTMTPLMRWSAEKHFCDL